MASDQDVRIRLLVENGQLRASLEQANSQLRTMGQNVTEVNRAAQGLGEIPQHLAKMSDAMEKLKMAATGLLAFGAIKHMANELIEAQVHLQQIKFTFAAAAGSAEAAGEEFDFVTKTADRLGVSLQATAETYGTFLVSAKAAHVTLKETHDIFLAVAEAGTVFHLSTQKMHSAMVAVEQMMGQGVIRSQELRMQLGGAIPGAYENFMNRVKAKGVDFNKAMQDGKLDVKTYAADLAEAIKGSFNSADVAGASEGLNSQLNRWKNMIFKFKTSISGGLFEESAAKTVEQAAKMGEAIMPLAERFGPLTTTAGFATLGILAFGKGVNEAGKKLSQIKGDFDQAINNIRNLGAEEHARTINSAMVAEAEERQARATLAAAEAAELKSIASASAAAAEVQRAESAMLNLATMEASSVSAAQLTGAEAKLALAELEAAAATTVVTTATDAKVKAQNLAVITSARSIELSKAAAVANVTGAQKVGLLSTATTLFSRGAAGLLSLLGGWPGVIMAAVAAIAYLATKETEESKIVKDLASAYDDLAKAKTAASIASSLPVVDATVANAKERLDELRQEADDLRASANKSISLNQGGSEDEDRYNSMMRAEVATSARRLEGIEQEIKMIERLRDEKMSILQIDKDREAVAHKIEKIVTDVDKQEQESASGKKKIAAYKGGDTPSAAIKAEATAARAALSALGQEVSMLAQMGGAEGAKGLAIAQQYSDAMERIANVERERLKVQKDLDKIENSKLAVGLRKELVAGLKELNEETKKNLYLATDVTDVERTHHDRIDALTKQYDAQVLVIKRLNETTHGSILGSKEQLKHLKQFKQALDKAKASVDVLSASERARVEQASYVSGIKEVASLVKDSTKQKEEAGRIEIENARALHTEVRPIEDARLERNRLLVEAYDERVKAIKAIDASTKKTATSEAQSVALLELQKVALKEATDASNALALAEQHRAERAGQIALAAFDKSSQRDLMFDQGERGRLDRREQAQAMVREAGFKVGSPEYTAELNKVATAMDALASAGSNMNAEIHSMGDSFSNTFGSMLSIDWVDASRNGFKNVAESWGEMLKKMADDLIKSGIMKAVKALVDIGLNAVFGGSNYSSNDMTLSGGKIGTFAAGGLISGPGSGTSDSIPARLSNGEFVLQSSAVAKYGVDFLNNLNDMRTHAPGKPRGFASGGLVGSAAGGGGIGGTQVTVVNNTGQESRTETKTGPNGNDLVEVIIGRVAADIQRNGKAGQAIQSTFGTTRKGVR